MLIIVQNIPNTTNMDKDSLWFVLVWRREDNNNKSHLAEEVCIFRETLSNYNQQNPGNIKHQNKKVSKAAEIE